MGGGMFMGPESMDQLNLTEEQKKKMEELRTEMMQKMNEATPETRREMFTQMRDKMNAILTDEQKAKMEQLRSERGNRMGGFGGQPGQPGQPGAGRGSMFPFQGLLDRLKLTDEQKTKVTQMQREAIEKLFNDIREKVLTPEQRKELEQLRSQTPPAGAPQPKPEAPKAEEKKPEAQKETAKPAATERPARQGRNRRQ
jgi:Spy/CpxP family protein refolding chaperone